MNRREAGRADEKTGLNRKGGAFPDMTVFFLILIAAIALILIICMIYSSVRGEKRPASRQRSGGSAKRSAEESGEEGEAEVARVLGGTIRGRKIVFNDFMFLDKKSGVSRQIDHIVVNRRGIFLIETKNHAGMIFGQEEQGQWTQVLGNGEKFRFYNPVKQNRTHMIALKQLLPQGAPVFSLIVFVRANLSNVRVENVITLSSLQWELDRDRGVYLNEDEISMYGDRISRIQAADVSKKEHIEEIRKMQEDIRNNICPRCGAKLKLRHGKFGDFYGCSRYPKCSFTKDIREDDDRKAG